MFKSVFLKNVFVFFMIVSAILLFKIESVTAHCDGLDGPVVMAAKKALETGNVNLVLIWVQKQDEAEIKIAFERTLAVRKLSAEAKELADMYFFETLVRIHRAGEGAPYTGVKPAGRDLGPAIPAADKALETGSLESLLKLMTETVDESIKEHFHHAMEKKNFNSNDVASGREYVEAYVTFIHYVERLFEAAKEPVQGHFQESEEETGMHKEKH